MGWNKRSRGNRYDSNSGHAFVIGARSNKIVDLRVLSKTCRVCQYAEKHNKKVQHVCPKNYSGPSKSMEVDALLNIVVALPEKKLQSA